MQRAVTPAQVLHAEERAPVERRQELDAGVDGLEAQLAAGIELACDNRASPAISLGTALLGARAAQVLAQMLQHGACRRRAVHFADRSLVVEADGMHRHSRILNSAEKARVTHVPVC